MPDYQPDSIRRGQIPPAGLMQEMQEQLAASSRMGGYGVVQHPDGTQFLPPDVEEIWVIISGQGSGSGSGSGLALTDNRYAGNQALIQIDTSGNETAIVDPSGLVFAQDVNPLIELNGATDVPIGYVCRAYLSPSRNAWHFVYGGTGSTGSGSGAGYTVTCADGSRYTVTISGTTVSVR